MTVTRLEHECNKIRIRKRRSSVKLPIAFMEILIIYYQETKKKWNLQVPFLDLSEKNTAPSPWLEKILTSHSLVVNLEQQQAVNFRQITNNLEVR